MLSKFLVSWYLGFVIAAPIYGAEAETGVSATKSREVVPDRLNSIGAKIGFVDVDAAGDPVMAFGAYTEYGLSRNFLISLNLDYWSKSSGAIAKESVSMSDLSLGLNGKFVFENMKALPSWKPFVGAGFAGHRFVVESSEDKQNGSTLDRYRNKDTDVSGKLGIDVFGGLAYEIQRALDAMLELRYRNVIENSGGLNQLAFAGGLAYKM